MQFYNYLGFVISITYFIFVQGISASLANPFVSDLAFLPWRKATWSSAKSHWGQSCLQCRVWACGLPSFLFFSLLWFADVAPHSISKIRHMSQEPSLEWDKSHRSTLVASRASLLGICRESCLTRTLVNAEVLQCGCLSDGCCTCKEGHGESSSVLFLSARTGEGLCSIFSPSFAQWDAMTFFSESVISQMFRTLDKDVCVPDAHACSPGLFWVDMSGFFQLCCPWKGCSNWLPPCKNPDGLLSDSYEE